MPKIKQKWVDIKGYKGFYQISTNHDIRNVSTRRILKISKHKGYYRLSLTKNRIRKHHSIHRLIALAFIPNPKKLPVVNHINRIKTDNRIKNLEWCTQLHNNKFLRKYKKMNMADINKLYLLSKKHNLQTVANKVGLPKATVVTLLVMMHPKY